MGPNVLYYTTALGHIVTLMQQSYIVQPYYASMKFRNMFLIKKTIK